MKRGKGGQKGGEISEAIWRFFGGPLFQADYREYSNQDHFGVDYLKEEFPELVDAVKTKLAL